VDKNPLAVEMAKLSLWLITLAKDSPFTFLDHSLKCGDSLLGVTNKEQIEKFHLNAQAGTQLPIVPTKCQPLLEKAIAKRKELENLLSNNISNMKIKEQLFLESEAALKQIRFIGNLLVGEALRDARKASNLVNEDLGILSGTVVDALSENSDLERIRKIEILEAKAQRMLNDRKTFHWIIEFPEVFLDESSPQGFDVIIGNPPFMGGQKITGSLGTEYRDFIVKWIANDKKGSADFCAYFFLRAKNLLNENGGFGLIATNTISQGDTREVGLDQLIENCTIYRAVPSRTWPGSASLEVAYVWLRKGDWKGDFILDEKPVNGITAFLTIPGKASGNPYQLAANQNKSFIGSYVLGMGFVLTPEEAQALIEKDAKNKDVLFPYLNGQDLNTNPDQSPNRWVINFQDWPLDVEHDDPKKPKGKPYASDYPDCLAIIREKVKPERDKNNRKERREKWWHYAEKCPALYSAIAKMERVLVAVQTSKYLSITFQPVGIVYSHMTVVFNLDDYSSFAILNISWHTEWIVEYCSSLETRLRNIPTDCFQTFPFPTSTANLEEIGEKYYIHRQNIMLTRQEGLTKTYNRFHNPDETNPDIEQLRTLHIEMDNAVAAAYGWEDIELDHDFHDTKQGIRFTICENARREILDRLLQLNHQRYAQEVAEGLHDKGKKKAKGGGKKKVQEEVNNDVKQIEMF
jgi:hypothetical protein